MIQNSLRQEKSVFGNWWWTVDRWTFFAILFLVFTGVVLVTAASPSVAERIGLTPFYFVYRHILFLAPSLGLLLVSSLLGRKQLWRVGSATLCVSMLLMVWSIFFGPEIKGATRWVHLFGFSLQPSEFAKPAFAVTSAWLIARYRDSSSLSSPYGVDKKSGASAPGYMMATFVFACVLGLLLLQPDLGMGFVLSSIWGVQIFLAGLPMIWVIVLGGLGAGGLFCAYLFFPHVSSRIDRFLDPASGDNYQVQKSLDAFANGGLFGTGPGHGQVKMNLPDAHADFIFSVAGEEFGLIAAILIISVFCFIIIRSITRILNSDDLFIVLATGGLLTQFALQSLVHMGSSLQLLPAKGMTLPFISYGGSSMLALGMGMGMLLSLTKKRSPSTSGTIWRGWSARASGADYGG